MTGQQGSDERVDGVVALLTDDAVVSMPPQPESYQGREAVEEFLRRRLIDRLRMAPSWRFVAFGANLQPAYAYYFERDGGWVRSGAFVLSVRGDGIASITRFHDDGLLDRFGVPARL